MISDLYFDEVDLDLLRQQYLELIELANRGIFGDDNVLWGLIQMLGDVVGDDTCCGNEKVRCETCNKNVCALGCDCFHEEDN